MLSLKNARRSRRVRFMRVTHEATTWRNAASRLLRYARI